jgi:hypothetical protein
MDPRIFVANILCCKELNRKVRSLKCFFRASSSAETTGQHVLELSPLLASQRSGAWWIPKKPAKEPYEAWQGGMDGENVIRIQGE